MNVWFIQKFENKSIKILKKDNRGLFTQPNQDDPMNMTTIGENDQKIDNDECSLLNMNENISSNVNVCCCEIFFGQILTNFWSY